MQRVGELAENVNLARGLGAAVALGLGCEWDVRDAGVRKGLTTPSARLMGAAPDVASIARMANEVVVERSIVEGGGV